MEYATLLFTRNHAAVIASFIICANVVGGYPACSQVNSQIHYGTSNLLQQTDFERSGHNQVLIAHHEGSAGAAAGVSATSGIGATQILATQGDADIGGNVTDSLWGNLLLQMACSRDQQLKAAAKKLKITDNLTLAGVYGISGLSLAQSITNLGVLNQSVTADAPAGTGHIHPDGTTGNESTASSRESAVPGILGIITSGSTLVTLGARFYFGRKYNKQISARQKVIVKRVENLLSRLEGGTAVEQLHDEFVELVGPRATREFSQLWHATYQQSVATVGGSG